VIDRIGGIIPELYRNRIEFELSKITPIFFTAFSCFWMKKKCLKNIPCSLFTLFSKSTNMARKENRLPFLWNVGSGIPHLFPAAQQEKYET
jgi:hypothetical protein